MDQHILIVGSSPGARVCEKLVKTSFEAKRRSIEELDEDDVSWSSFVLIVSGSLRREIASAYPDAYLSRRVISLNIPEERAENRDALRSMVSEQLENHGLYVR